MVSVLTVKPNGMKKQNVPRIETGIARIGIMVDRKFCRNSKPRDQQEPVPSAKFPLLQPWKLL